MQVHSFCDLRYDYFLGTSILETCQLRDGSLNGFSYLCKATLPQEWYGVVVGGLGQEEWGGTTLSLTIDT